jgi:hypothetical protein
MHCLRSRPLVAFTEFAFPWTTATHLSLLHIEQTAERVYLDDVELHLTPNN